MTAAFDALVAAGSGKLDFRLTIEGLDTVFVSSEEMADTADSLGRAWVPGLRHGAGFSERVYLPGAELDVSIDAMNVDETPGTWLGVATRVFTTIAQRVSTLTVTLTAAGTTATVLDSSPFTVNAYYYLGTETVQVTAKPTGTTLTIVRARWQSTAQEHPVSSGESALSTDIYDAPTGLAGRRVWLYAHTQDEFAVEAATVVWRGVLAREPSLSEDDALAWSLAVEPRTKALEASLAGGFDEGFKLRGAYYPGANPFWVSVRRWAGPIPTSVSGETSPLPLAGFFVSQAEFCAALVAMLNANADVISWGIEFSATAGEQWDLYVTTASADARYISVSGGSSIDGAFEPSLGTIGPDGLIATTYSVSATTSYVCIRNPYYVGPVSHEDQRRIPRSSNYRSSFVVSSDADVTAYPIGRLYLDRLGALTSGTDDLVVAPMYAGTSASPSPLPDEDLPADTMQIVALDAGAGYVEVAADAPLRVCASGSVQPVITGGARYASGDGSLEAFRVDLLARAPSVANRGRGPWVTDDDIASWASVVTEAAAGRDWLAHRVYTYAKPVKAIDVLREEWKLYGVFPHLDADARLVISPLTVDTSSTVSAVIDSGELLADETLGGITPDADGLINVVHLLRGYDPSEDKHVERDFIFRGMSAIARVHVERVLEIAPMSRAVGAEPEWTDVYDTAARVIDFFGTRRAISVSFEVTLEAFPILVGDWFELTIGALPLDGARAEWSPGEGITSRRALLIGRSWDLGAGVGRFEALVPENASNAAGYAPSARITAASGATTNWTLTVTATHYSTSGDLTHFAAGQAIRIIEFDAGSPTIREGTITVINSSTSLDVVIDSWGGMGGATYYTLCYDTSDDAQTTATQLTRAYLAGSGGRIALTGGATTGARDFAP